MLRLVLLSSFCVLAGCATKSQPALTRNVQKVSQVFGKGTSTMAGAIGKGSEEVRNIAMMPLDYARKSGGYMVTAQPGQVSTQGMCWPVIGRVSRGFNTKIKHQGLDICAPEGCPIVAAADGKVIYSGNGLSGYGNSVILEHGSGLYTIYGHNSRNLVREDQSVRRGQTIALVGETGNATTPHCHFEIRKVSQPIDPRPYLP